MNTNPQLFPSTAEMALLMLMKGVMMATLPAVMAVPPHAGMKVWCLHKAEPGLMPCIPTPAHIQGSVAMVASVLGRSAMMATMLMVMAAPPHARMKVCTFFMKQRDISVCQLPIHCCPFPGTCGDGAVGSGEACDDGNHASGDGCSPTCKIEGLAPP